MSDEPIVKSLRQRLEEIRQSIHRALARADGNLNDPLVRLLTDEFHLVLNRYLDAIKVR